MNAIPSMPPSAAPEAGAAPEATRVAARAAAH